MTTVGGAERLIEPHDSIGIRAFPDREKQVASPSRAADSALRVELRPSNNRLRRILALSLAFQAQSHALAQTCNERIRAAGGSPRSKLQFTMSNSKPRPPVSGHGARSPRTLSLLPAFQAQSHALAHTCNERIRAAGGSPRSKLQFTMSNSKPRPPVSGHGARSPRTLSLLPAFQAQSHALAHTCNERIRAAGGSPRSKLQFTMSNSKPRPPVSGHGARSPRTLSLLPAFQAQSHALAHTCNERIRAAGGSPRSKLQFTMSNSKPRPPVSGHGARSPRTLSLLPAFQAQSHALAHTCNERIRAAGGSPRSKLQFTMSNSKPRPPVSGHGVLSIPRPAQRDESDGFSRAFLIGAGRRR